MRIISRFILLPAALIMVLLISCTDRGPNTPDRPTSLGHYTGQGGHDFIEDFLLQIGSNGSFQGPPRILKHIWTYYPEVGIPPITGGEPQKVPLLILLAPQFGDEWYFFNHGLQELANELIAEGTIEPMAIACVPNDNIFGGYFYAGSSDPAGHWDSFLSSTLLEYLYLFVGSCLSDRLPVGIGGVGQGGYGAFRASILNPGMFVSVSATDGPMDFDGSAGYAGLDELFDDCLTEQNLLGGVTDPPVIDTTWLCNIWDTTAWDSIYQVDSTDTVDWLCTDDSIDVGTGDTICIDSLPLFDSTLVDSIPSDSVCLNSSISRIDTTWPPSWREEFDTSYAHPLSWLFIGGALAFSPNDTLIDTVGIYRPGGLDNYSITLPDSQRYQIDDTMTLITEIISQEQFDFDFHLPFDSNGNIYSLIWNMWLDDNLENLLTNNANSLDSIQMYVVSTPEFAYANYRPQTQSWISTLQGSPYSYTAPQLQVVEYNGYTGNPATNDQYLYDLMRDILIFHSKAFEAQR
ncbi:MAG: alpha/beta hydrolase-fold protein [bacterium]